ncbi:MAG: hypothetical protein PHT49_01035 [Desulfovibrionales bacterium]|nr:hypothetical protein [Desulfovibrionales bacterium]
MKIINKTTKINAAGSPPKQIEELIGLVNSKDDDVSIARMRSPEGWSEPGQIPDFNEYTIMLKGTLKIETKNGISEIKENEAVIIERGEWVKYSTPYKYGAEYIAICIPAFSPKRVHRDE